ncbi:MAG TPA: hypothetical protein VGN72_03710 [Tepidisphaeraceae bacterium]|jgi:hypothetical protein|nr:hypothetical protein [Tepidisphaeraceae bacterium]
MMLSSKSLSMIASGVVAAALSAATTAEAAAPSLKVYHVGNSVTDTINYSGLGSLAAQAGGQYTMGRHMIPGAPLEWLWKNQDSGFTEAAYGAPNNAFVNHKWDVITLQPFDRLMTQDDGFGDRATVSRYVDLALQNPDNKDAQVYIYSRWPRRAEFKDANDKVTGYKPFNYQEQWDRKYTGGWDNTNETRDYFKQLLDGAREDHGQQLTKRVLMVPVGDVLYEIDKRAKAGSIPGLSDVSALYGDGIHFGNLGSFITGSTFFATLYKQNPAGMTIPTTWTQPYTAYTGSGNFDLPGMADDPARSNISAETINLLQQTIWDVVSTHPDAGVAAVPEPGAMILIGPGLFAFGRRRCTSSSRTA